MKARTTKYNNLTTKENFLNSTKAFRGEGVGGSKESDTKIIYSMTQSIHSTKIRCQARE